MEELVRSAISHKAAIDSSKRDIRDNKLLIKKMEKELTGLNELYHTTRFSYDYLEQLVKEESGKFIRRLNDVLDFGVKSIFYDCEYSIEIRVSENSKATIHLVYDDDDGNKISPDIQNCGGGVRTITGILMQIYFIFHYKIEPVLFVDEGFSQVSSHYLPNLFSLIDELCRKNGLKVLLVTHDDRMLPYATKRYEISDHTAVEVKVVREEVLS